MGNLVRPESPKDCQDLVSSRMSFGEFSIWLLLPV